MTRFLGERGSGKTMWAAKMALYHGGTLICRDPKEVEAKLKEHNIRAPKMMSYWDYGRRGYVAHNEPVIIDEISSFLKVVVEGKVTAYTDTV